MRHIAGVLMLCWVRALRAGAIVALLTAVAVEIAEMVVLRRFPPDGMAQLVAAGLAFGLGYAVAITIIADELLVGILDGVGHLLGDAEAGARAAAIAAEREIGEVGSSLFRVGPLGGVAAVVGALIDRTGVSRAPAEDPVFIMADATRSSRLDRATRGEMATRREADSTEQAWSSGQVATWDRDASRDWPTDETLADLATDGDEMAEEAGEESEAPTIAEMPAIAGRVDDAPAPTGQPVHASECHASPGTAAQPPRATPCRPPHPRQFRWPWVVWRRPRTGSRTPHQRRMAPPGTTQWPRSMTKTRRRRAFSRWTRLGRHRPRHARSGPTSGRIRAQSRRCRAGRSDHTPAAKPHSSPCAGPSADIAARECLGSHQPGAGRASGPAATRRERCAGRAQWRHRRASIV